MDANCLEDAPAGNDSGVRTAEGNAEGGIDLSGLEYKVMIPGIDGGEPMAGAVLKYGAFIQNVIDFLIIAFCIFLMIKAMNKLTAKKEEEPAPAPEPSAEEKLLTEIRDLMKKK